MTQNDSQKREERLKMNPQDHETYYAPEAVKKLIDENASLKALIEELETKLSYKQSLNQPLSNNGEQV